MKEYKSRITKNGKYFSNEGENPTIAHINLLMKLFLTGAYTIGCVFGYLLTHYIYWYQNKHKYVLLFWPFGYFAFVKTGLYVLNCNPYSNLIYAANLSRQCFQQGLIYNRLLMDQLYPDESIAI